MDFTGILLTVNKIQEPQTSFHRNDTCSVHTQANLLPCLAIYQVPAQAGIYCEASCFQAGVCQFFFKYENHASDNQIYIIIYHPIPEALFLFYAMWSL